MKHFFELFAFVFFMVNQSFAYDGDMDTYHEFKEELSLIRDGYVACINMAMEDANENDPEGWFKLRDRGGASSWAEIDYSAPAASSIPHLTFKEAPYGFRITGKHGAYKLDVTVRVVTRDNDIFYDVKHAKGSNEAGKEIFGEIFHNDRVVFYDNAKPCKRESVTCIHEYEMGTPGKAGKK